MKQIQSESNFDIKLQEHFKLYILLKDKIVFETELRNKGIEFYTELNEQPFIERGIRYFLLDIDRPRIDKIIIENKIVARTETILISDYRDEKKIAKMYFLVGGIVVGIIILISIVWNLFRS